ncbi:hypothetical protein GEMRC1_012827 [Eukaryota sp. GEM-RC1]
MAWIKRQSNSRPGVYYYFNTETGQSQWEEPEESANQPQWRASHILVKHKNSRRPSSWREPHITRTVDEALDILENYRSSIVNNTASFEDISSKYSDCGSAKNGGDLGFFGPGQMQRPFEDAVKSLGVGDVSGAVHTDSGVHIIKRTA